MNRFAGFVLAASVVLPLAAADSESSRPAGRTIVDQSHLCMTTLANLRSIRSAIEEYAIDNGRLPDVASFEALRPLLAPAYMRIFEAQDAWGTELVYRLSADRKSFVVASAGSDRKFDESSWMVSGLFEDSRADAVVGSDETRDREWTIQK